MQKRFKIIARHEWIEGVKLTESMTMDNSTRRYTATIRGFRGWLIYEGDPRMITTQHIINVVSYIRDSIDAGDDDIFKHKGSACDWMVEKRDGD